MRNVDTGIVAIARGMFMDDSGKVLVGMEHGVTAEQLLEKAGRPPRTHNKQYYQYDLNKGRVIMNIVMSEFSRAGFVAGGASRDPTVYFIARKNHKREESFILLNKIPQASGRLAAIARAGSNLIDTSRVESTRKMLDNAAKKIKSNIKQLEDKRGK